MASYSALNKIDVGIYIVTTRGCQKILHREWGHKWEGSLSYEKVVRYLPQVKNAITIPILVIGIDL